MKIFNLLVFALLSFFDGSFAGAIPISEKTVQEAVGDKNATFVIVDCASKASSVFNSAAADEKLAPCSTFKIWNTLIGLEEGIIHSPEQAFYQ